MKCIYRLLSVIINLLPLLLFAQEKNLTDRLQIFITGDSADVQTATRPGLLLAGGSTDQTNAMRWMIDRCGGGDVVIIRSSGADGYNQYLFELGNVNSVETILINSKAKAELPIVAEKIRKAELLFIAGGDQWNYVNYWRNTPVEEAINYLINIKQVPVGGTSAGCAIMGEFYFSAQYNTIQSTEALESPYHISNTIGRGDFVHAPVLRSTITDSHYSQRKRQGRLISWLARLAKEEARQSVRGIGVDEKTAVAIDENGWATVFGANEAWFVWTKPGKPTICEPGEPLHWTGKSKPILAYVIKGDENGKGRFNLNNWKEWEGGTIRQFKIDNGKLAE